MGLGAFSSSHPWWGREALARVSNKFPYCKLHCFEESSFLTGDSDSGQNKWSGEKRTSTFIFFSVFFFLFVVNFVIHWNQSAMGLHVFPIQIPPPNSLSTHSLYVFAVHQVQALVSCIQPGLVICFTLDNIHVLMLFSWNIPPSPCPTEPKRLFYKSVSFFSVLHIGLSLTYF